MPPASPVALEVLQILQLNCRADDQGNDPEPVEELDCGSSCAGAGRCTSNELKSCRSIRQVRDAIDDVTNKEVLVCATKIIIEPVSAEAGECFGEDAKPGSVGDEDRDDAKLDLTGRVGRDATCGDGSPWFVEAVFHDACWFSLVGDGEDEDVEPRPEKELGKIGEDFHVRNRVDC